MVSSDCSLILLGIKMGASNCIREFRTVCAEGLNSPRIRTDMNSFLACVSMMEMRETALLKVYKVFNFSDNTVWPFVLNIFEKGHSEFRVPHTVGLP